MATEQDFNSVSAVIPTSTTTADIIGSASETQDLMFQIDAANQVQWQVSVDGTNYTDLLSIVIGAVLRLEAGSRLRLRNTDAVSTHRYVVTFWPRTIVGA